MRRSGILITFEGIDGSGKSTQANLLVDFLKRRGYPVVFVREPGGTRISEQIRRILLDTKNDEIHHRTELLLYLAARAEVVDKVILPAVTGGNVVVADRFSDSTFAYQIHGRALPAEIVKAMNRFAAAALTPDLTFLVDLPVERAQQRLQKKKDRLEASGLSFHQRVRKGFLQLAASNPKRIMLLDGREGPEQLWEQVRSTTLTVLRRRAIVPAS